MKLIALDLDGTLFNNKSQISRENIKAIKEATAAGINVVISTGRPLGGLPFEAIKGTGIRYAITANGSAIYEIDTQKCLYENCLSDETAFSIIDYLMTKRVHMDAFINGCGYSPYKCLEDAKDLKIPPSIKEYIMTTRKRVNDITEMMRENNYHMQKMTINFPKDVNDNYYCRDEVFEHLKKIPEITLVSGGYGNLEFTKAGVDKGVALHKLAQILNIAADETMAVGDTENDMAIVKAAHIGVAMGNATDELKAQADYVTDTNENDGVAKAIRHFMG